MSEDSLTVRVETESESAEQVVNDAIEPPSAQSATSTNTETVLALEVGRLSATVDEVCRRLGAVESAAGGAAELAETAVAVAVDAVETAESAQMEAAVAVDVAELAEVQADIVELEEAADEQAQDEPPDREHPFFRPRRRHGEA